MGPGARATPPAHVFATSRVPDLAALRDMISVHAKKEGDGLSKHALLVCDGVPDPALVQILRLDGYDIELVHSIDTAVLWLNRAVPDCAFVGPLREDHGIRVFLEKLVELKVNLTVIAHDPSLARLAKELHVRVRWPSAPDDEAEARVRPGVK